MEAYTAMILDSKQYQPISYNMLSCGVLSPLQKQVKEIKDKFNNPVVWFKINEFYEMIGEDAILTDAVLDIGLTQRPDNGLELAGFDANMLDVYLPIMTGHGNRVALVKNI